MAHSAVVQDAIAFVQDQLQANDASHDWRHVESVWTLARVIAEEECLPVDRREIVDLAALLHDIDDYKYQDESGPMKRAETFLCSRGVAGDQIALVLSVIDRIGFKEELEDGKNVIGIARAFTYGGAKRRALFDPAIPPYLSMTKDAYVDPTRPSMSIDMFYEKLLKLRVMMKTNTGRRIAEQHHAFMQQFLAQ